MELDPRQRYFQILPATANLCRFFQAVSDSKGGTVYKDHLPLLGETGAAGSLLSTSQLAGAGAISNLSVVSAHAQHQSGLGQMGGAVRGAAGGAAAAGVAGAPHGIQVGDRVRLNKSDNDEEEDDML